MSVALAGQICEGWKAHSIGGRVVGFGIGSRGGELFDDKRNYTSRKEVRVKDKRVVIKKHDSTYQMGVPKKNSVRVAPIWQYGRCGDARPRAPRFVR